MPLATSLEAILVSSKEEPRVPDATSMAASPTASDILRSLLNSLVANQSPGVVDVEEAGPSRSLEELVLERTAPPPVAEANSYIVRVEVDPLAWGGPTLSWMDEDSEPFFVLDNVEEKEMWSMFQNMARVRGSYFLHHDIFFFPCHVMMLFFLLRGHGEVRSQVCFYPSRARCLVYAAAPNKFSGIYIFGFII